LTIAAVICEYNPFHNGHALHLQAARERTNARYVVCAMSGSWVQRGEPAIVDKWTRARMALAHGADLVLELPAAWAVRAAPDFALGAVSLLDSLGVCTHLCFGSELPPEDLRAALAQDEDAAAVRDALAAGRSYPRAVSQGESTRLPNATLALEYLRALEALSSGMQPVAIRRDAPHDAPGIRPLSSATAIRDATRAGHSIEQAMPGDAHALYREALTRQGGGATWENLSRPLLDRLRTAQDGQLSATYGLSEGLDNRLIKASITARSVQELLTAVKTKRYTLARLRRGIAHILLDPPQQCLDKLPAYARVLGFRKDAEGLLRAIDRQGRVPLVTKLPRTLDDEQLSLDLRAQDLWALACPLPQRAHMDYARSIVKASG
jgi:predicted nucleotidyltransferase